MIGTTIETFMKTATDEQKAVIEKIMRLADEERHLVERIEEIYDPYKRQIEGISEMIHGQMAAFSRQDIYEQGMTATYKERKKLVGVSENIAQQLKQAVNLGMGNLSFIKRHYEDYLGRPMT